MDFGFETISEQEYERQRALYTPLTDAVRRLIDAAIHTDAAAETVRDAQRRIEAVTELLERERGSERVPVRLEPSGRPVTWANPAVGLRNAIAPPITIHHEDDGRCWSEFVLGPVYEGPPGWVHGGICALVLDHVLGEVASDGLTQPRFTGTISLRYLRGTPLGQLRAEAFVERTEGPKTFARGALSDADGITVEAEGVFITPAWARDAG
ncbi:PaaI family thioesterase [Mycolicibacterium sp. XJ1819]